MAAQTCTHVYTGSYIDGWWCVKCGEREPVEVTASADSRIAPTDSLLARIKRRYWPESSQ